MKLPALCAVLAICCLAAPAQALASTHAFQGIVAAGTPPEGGGFPAPPPVLFDDACGVALDAAGNRYVSDYNHGFVAVFNASSGYLTKIPSQVAQNSACDLAIDSTGRLYANDLHQAVVQLRPGPAVIDTGRSTGVAVGPDNRIYVAHRDHVSVYPPGGGALALTIGSGSLTDAYGVAVSSSGEVYVADAASNTIKVFDSATPSTPVQTIDGAGSPGGAFSDLSDTDLAISPTSGNLLVLDDLQPGNERPHAAVDEFNPAGAYVGQISHWKVVDNGKTTPFSLIHGQPGGLAVDAAGNIYLTSGNEEGSVLYGFGPATLAGARVQVTDAGGGAGPVTSQLSGVSNSAFTGIECGQLCATEYEGGEAVTFRATPAPHSTFAGWSIPGQPACATNPSCRFQLFGATQVTATFAAIPQETLTVTKAGAGAVTSSPEGLECGTACSQSFDQGAKVILSAEPAPGSEFTGWAGACSGTGSCSLILTSNIAVSANFQPIDLPAPIDHSRSLRTLAIAVGGSGAGSVSSNPAGIECGSPCSASYAPGTTVTLTATPDSESHFAGWDGCDSATAERCTVTLAASRTVSAGFAEGPALRLGAVKSNTTGATLTVTVPGAGILSASAKQLRPAKLTAKRAGTLTLALALNKAARQALAKRGKLAIKVAISFKPSGGGAPLDLVKTITFKNGRRRSRSRSRPRSPRPTPRARRS